MGRAERRLPRAARDRAAAALGALLPQLCDWTKRQGALLRGATEGTHLQNDGFDFLNLGYYLERGDNTARLLDVKYYVLLPTTDMVGGSIDTYQWTTLCARSRPTAPSTGPTAASTARARSPTS